MNLTDLYLVETLFSGAIHNFVFDIDKLDSGVVYYVNNSPRQFNIFLISFLARFSISIFTSLFILTTFIDCFDFVSLESAFLSFSVSHSA